VNADGLSNGDVNAKNVADGDVNNDAGIDSTVIDADFNADDLSDVRGRMQELAIFATSAARLGEPEVTVLPSGQERANRPGAMLVGVAASVVALTAGIALAWTSDSAQVDAVARPAAPTVPSSTSVLTPTPTPAPQTTPSLPVSATTAPDPEVALPDAYRVYLDVPGLVLAGDVEFDQDLTSPGLVARVIQGPSSTVDGPVAMVVTRPLDANEVLLGKPVTTDDGTSGVLNVSRGLALLLSWSVGDVVVSLSTYGFEEAQAIQLMGRVDIDPADPEVVVFDADPSDDLTMDDAISLSTQSDYQSTFCTADGRIAISRRPSVPTNLIGLLLQTGAPIERASLDSGEWFLMTPSPEQTLAVTMSDASMVVAIIAGLEPESILNDAMPVTRSRWDELLDTDNVTSLQQGECPEPAESLTPALLFGEILLTGDIPVAVCDGVGPGVPGLRFGATPDAPTAPNSAGALTDFVEWWSPGADQPNNMPVGGWWAIPDEDSVAYGWGGGQGDTAPELFTIVIYTERGPDGWSVTRWESSGC